jgi:hypothetical protein
MKRVSPCRNRPALLPNSFSPCLSHLCACLNLRTRCLNHLCRCLSWLCACMKQVCACLNEVCGCMKRLCTCLKHFCTCMKHLCGCMERVCAWMKGRCGCLSHCFPCVWRKTREIRPVFTRLRAFRLEIGQEQGRRASHLRGGLCSAQARSSGLRSGRAERERPHHALPQEFRLSFHEGIRYDWPVLHLLKTGNGLMRRLKPQPQS